MVATPPAIPAAEGQPAEEAGDIPRLRDGYKRPFDLTILALAHLVLLPLWALLWTIIPLAIWLTDRGGVFYTQERLGRNGKRFVAIKFRTMTPGAEAATGPVWALEDDPRITAVGRVLRRFHLDEMPQTINIIKGDMSLVGPRPERPVLAERFNGWVPAFDERLHVKPGIAGLAQVRGDYSMSPAKKIRYDTLYMEKMSPWLDLRLLFLAVWVTLRSTGGSSRA